jgi:hypothetical protein
MVSGIDKLPEYIKVAALGETAIRRAIIFQQFKIKSATIEGL